MFVMYDEHTKPMNQVQAAIESLDRLVLLYIVLENVGSRV